MTAIKRAVSPRAQRTIPSCSTVPTVMASRTPLTDYICSRLQGENLKLFALMFAEAIKTDRHANVILFENVYHFLGYTRYDSELKNLFPAIQAVPMPVKNLRSTAEVSSGARGPSKDSYLISVRQFESLMLAAKTDDGGRAREMMLDVKDAVQDYMKMEMENAAKAVAENERIAQSQLREQMSKLVTAEQEKTALATQLKNLRQAKSYLYAFWLFDNRYKCGVTDNPDKREKQHKTSCPSGHMVCSVVIACKQSEKLLDSIMKRHGCHVRQEEYEICGDEERIRVIFETIARVEESLHSIPFEKYDMFSKVVTEFLDTTLVNISTDTNVSVTDALETTSNAMTTSSQNASQEADLEAVEYEADSVSHQVDRSQRKLDYHCPRCRKDQRDRDGLEKHLTRRHQCLIGCQDEKLECTHCHVHVKNVQNWEKHLSSDRHRNTIGCVEPLTDYARSDCSFLWRSEIRTIFGDLNDHRGTVFRTFELLHITINANIAMLNEHSSTVLVVRQRAWALEDVSFISQALCTCAQMVKAFFVFRKSVRETLGSFLRFQKVCQRDFRGIKRLCRRSLQAHRRPTRGSIESSTKT